MCKHCCEGKLRSSIKGKGRREVWRGGEKGRRMEMGGGKKESKIGQKEAKEGR